MCDKGEQNEPMSIRGANSMIQIHILFIEIVIVSQPATTESKVFGSSLLFLTVRVVVVVPVIGLYT